MAFSALLNPISANLQAGEALVGVNPVIQKSDGKIYKAADTTDALNSKVYGYTRTTVALDGYVDVYPGVDDAGVPVALSFNNSTTSAILAADLGDTVYIESSSTLADGTEAYVVAKSSSHSVVAGVFRGFTGITGTMVKVQIS